MTLADFHARNRSYAEDQRKRAARQVRDLVNIAKQGESCDCGGLPCLLPWYLSQVTDPPEQRWAPNNSSDFSTPSINGPCP